MLAAGEFHADGFERGGVSGCGDRGQHRLLIGDNFADRIHEIEVRSDREPNQPAEAGSGGRGFGDGLLGDLDDFAEDFRLVNRQLAERFAIELDAGQDHASSMKVE